MSSLDDLLHGGATGGSDRGDDASAGGDRVFSLDGGDGLSSLEELTRRARRKAAEWRAADAAGHPEAAGPADTGAADATAGPAGPGSSSASGTSDAGAAGSSWWPVASTGPTPTVADAVETPQTRVLPTVSGAGEVSVSARATPTVPAAQATVPADRGAEQPGFASQVRDPAVERLVQERDQQRTRAGLQETMHPDLRECLRLVIERGASDLHIGVDVAPSFRIDGDLQHLPQFSTPWGHEQMHAIVKSILTPEEFEQLVDEFELDLGIDCDEDYRFRVNLSFDRLGVAGVFRLIPNEVLSLKQLNMPESLYKLADMPRGLVLVTGPTGSGKSTTLAAMIDRVNETRPCHILTIEDPIEYVHKPKQAVVNQREVGRDTKSFNEALRRALRQDPDVILVGELRDHETIQVALTAAETGHLVLSTLHTQDSVQTVDRIIDVFPAAQQGQIRTQLAGTLRGVVSQTLLKRVGGGRVAASEILLGTSAVSNMIREGKTHLLYSALQSGSQYGMRTLDQNLAELVGTGQVDRSEAEVYVKDPQAFRSLRNRISTY